MQARLLHLCRNMPRCGLALTLLAAVGPARAATETVVYAFKSGTDGQYPLAGMIRLGAGTLYGTTRLGGAANGIVFKIDAAGAESVVYAFQPGNDGSFPVANLAKVGSHTLYGTTYQGGTSNNGTVFKVTPAGVEKVLHSFQGGSDGANPGAGLIDIGGTFYGTTEQGGANGQGTVFSMTPAGAVTVLHSFAGGSDGAYPQSGLIDVNGTLYGTTAYGGGTPACFQGCGTVFKITPAGSESVVYPFQGGTDGFMPDAGLLKLGSTLYGTTAQGGGSSANCSRLGCGTVFKVTLAGAETVLHAFQNGADGYGPAAGLIDFNGTLYGTTSGGGSASSGTVFEITPAGLESVIYAFKGGSDGESPAAPMIPLGGALYGTTEFGGNGGGYGTVFKVVP